MKDEEAYAVLLIVVVTVIGVATVCVFGTMTLYVGAYTDMQMDAMDDLSIIIGNENIIHVQLPANMPSQTYYIYTSTSEKISGEHIYAVNRGEHITLPAKNINVIFVTWMPEPEVQYCHKMYAMKYSCNDDRSFIPNGYRLVEVV